MKNCIIIFLSAFSLFALVKLNQQDKAMHPNNQYQLWIEDGFYILKDGDRVVWRDKVGSGSDIDHLIIEDNL